MAKVFVDREYELERLAGFLERASGGSPTFVFISGEAGVGKADLVDHFYGLNEDKLVPFSHYANRDQRAVPYHAFNHFIERFAAMDERALGEEVAALLTKIGGLLSTKSSLVGDVAKEREVMFEAFSEFFQSVSRDRMISLFIENFQWCDEGSILLVQHLAQQLESCNLLFIATYRPEELEETSDTVHPITGLMATLMMEDKLNTFIVERFDIEGTGKMLSALLGIPEVPANFLEFVYEESQGSPMYVSELVEDMLQTGTLDVTRPHWAEEFDPEEVRTPGGMKDIISRRLDHIDRDLYDVLRTASVIGSTFAISDLAELTDRPVVELSASMSEAIEKQILYEVLDRAEESYAFDHSKIKDVLYESLDGTDRKALHMKIGAMYEERNRPLELAYSLAHHFTRAEDLARGYRYSRLSGDLALGAHSPTEAFKYYSGALKLITGTKLLKGMPEERVGLLVTIGEIAYIIGKWDKAVQTLEQAVLSAREVRHDELIAKSLIALSDIIRFKAVDNPRSLELYSEALEISEKAGSDGMIAKANRGMGYIHWREGEFDEAEEHYEITIKSAEKAGNKRLVGAANTELGNLMSSKGELEESVKRFATAIKILEEEKDMYELARAYNNLGDTYLQLHDWDKAIEIFDKCGEIAGEYGLKDFQGWALFNAAEALAKKGELEKALENCERAKIILTKLNDQVGLEGIEKNLGTIYRFKKDWDKAEEHFARSHQMTVEMGFPHPETEVLLEWGSMYLDKGDESRAKEVLEKAVEIALKIDAKEIAVKAKALMKDGGIS